MTARVTITIDGQPATPEQWIEHIATLDRDASVADRDPASRLLHWSAGDDGETHEAVRDLGDMVAIELYAKRRAPPPVPGRPPGRPPGPANPARDARVLAALVSGESIASIARRIGLSRQRVSQIAARVRAPAD